MFVSYSKEEVVYWNVCVRQPSARGARQQGGREDRPLCYYVEDEHAERRGVPQNIFVGEF